MDPETMYSRLDSMFTDRRTAAEIENYLRDVLKEAESAGSGELVIAACNELGGLARARGDFKEAEALHMKVLRLLEEAGQKGNLNYATALINCGDVYASADENERALEIFLEAEAMLKALGQDGMYPMAALCNNISKVYICLGQNEKAEKALEKALEIIEALPGMWQEKATTYVNAAEAAAAAGKLKKAAETFAGAIALFREHGVRDQHYAAALAGEARLRFMEGAAAEAAGGFNEAAEIIKEIYGENSIYRLLKENAEKAEKGGGLHEGT
ncbi:MAG TPA: tetratricopeptide repeat protein [Candidatus Copromorpha excrementigallinarum]|uniref:Tetratricopeptide repeat protein n=1 Tax=Candidatus Allocopromorpha excrementigallinarum TaxID=2840742 RepID=A0A9D1I0T4_9FIRM|nr:tetratricopeptide repeat protein [Candidatus Copromorpha excrementigallinarum]